MPEIRKDYILDRYVEIAPRIERWGGFEHSSGEVINIVSPERATGFWG